MAACPELAAAEKSRSRRRLGSQRRAGPVRASIGIQAGRSRDLDDLQPELVLRGLVEGQVAQAGVAGGADALLGACALAAPYP
ncbi:hypothetical protein [Streptantibioticus ferralitis]|uniref:hypothetical protein n=1 Tax=Streptantibioticus ferralitis TaxID=236510 RepID=UPI003381CFCC